MNQNYLLDREFFNISTKDDNFNKKKIEKINKNQKKIKNNILYLDRNEFKNNHVIEKKELNNKNEEDLLNKKINDLKFNNYQNVHKKIKNDRIEFFNKKKENINYEPYKRNIKIEQNLIINQLDFSDNSKKNDYYKNINLNKFNPNINYNEFIKKD